MTDELDRLKAALADKYAIERELGRGGMATVYLAEDLKHHRKVAVKVLRPDLAAALGPDRFLREIEVAARLQHPHILPLHDSGEADGFLYYVMPYVEGESLRAKLAREGELPIADAVRILRDVVDALTDAHEHGVVHRDIKPDNVLLTKHHAVVTDFGIAKAVSEATGRQQLTTAGVALGTPAYMAPEQAVADPHIDHRADIYAVGALAYELLTGRPPFTGTTAQQVLSAHVTETAEPVTKHRETVPPALAQLVMKCLEKKPADRWQSAEELVSQLEALATPSGGITPTDTRSVVTAPPRSRKATVAIVVAATVLVTIGGYAVITRTIGSPESVAAAEPPKLAVLPFNNLGSSADDYFADGITEEITSRIAEISGLGVISRQSANQYKNSDKTLRQIGEELGVEYVLEGTIRTDRVPDGAGQVRVTPQLIRVSDDANLWTSRYTANLVPGEIFGVQEQIANQVAQALDVTLLEPERQRLAAQPTENQEAYDSFLRGLSYERRGSTLRRIEDARLAAEMFARATELDPNYVEAYAMLARTYGDLFFQYNQLDAGPKAKEAADRATALAQDHPASHIALGSYHYLVTRQFDVAEPHLASALQARPNDVSVLINLADVQRRRGKWDAAVSAYEAALDLDPRSEPVVRDLGRTYYLMRRYTSAEDYLNRSVALLPDSHWGNFWRMMLYLTWDGSTERASQALEEASGRADLLRFLLVSWDFDDAMVLRIFAEHFADALQGRTLQGSPDDSAAYYLAKAQAAKRNDAVLARAYSDSARVKLEQRLARRPDDPRDLSRLGLAYAGLGRVDDARRTGERAVDLQALDKDAWAASYTIPTLAEIYTMIGEHDAAIDQLELVLSIPSIISVPLLRLDPVWNPLRNHPRFQALLAKDEN